MMSKLPQPHAVCRIILATLIGALASSCSSGEKEHAAHAPVPASAPATSQPAPAQQVKGLVDSIDYAKGEMIVRLSPSEGAAEGAVAKVQINDETRIQNEHAAAHGGAQPESLSDVRTGMPVTVAGQESPGGVLEASAVVLVPACKEEYCSKKNCRHKCGAKKCLCPTP